MLFNILSELKGFYRCQKCLPCRVSRQQPRLKESFRSTATNQEFKIKELITCNSTHVTLLKVHLGYNMWVEPPDPCFSGLGNRSTILEKGSLNLASADTLTSLAV